MLKNTMFKLQNNLPLTIGYLGGSITEGAGVKEEKDCWRCKITEWFCDNYPDSEIIEAAAGIGGTGSDFGMFRCERDIIAKKSDLVFIEFAVNDMQRSNSLENMEAIVRKLLTANPLTDIVLVVTAHQAMHDLILKDEYIKSLDTYQKISGYYGIDIVNVGEEIISRVDSGEGDWKAYTIDTVHPNELGYSLYTNKIINYLKKNLELPHVLTHDKYKNAHMIDASENCETNFSKLDKSFCGRWPRMIEANEKGKYLEMKFRGTSVGIYMMIASDSGDYTWSIDGSEPVRATTWDKYAMQFDRANYSVLANGLDDSDHILRIEVLGECNEKSKGTYIRIAAFLIA